MPDKNSFHYKEPRALLLMGTNTLVEVLNKKQVEFSRAALKVLVDCEYIVYLQRKTSGNSYGRFLVMKVNGTTRDLLRKAFRQPVGQQPNSMLFTFNEYARCPVSWSFGWSTHFELDPTLEDGIGVFPDHPLKLRELELDESYFVFKPWTSGYKFKDPVTVEEQNLERACDALVEILRGRKTPRPAEAEWLVTKRGITPLSMFARLELFKEAATCPYVIEQVGRWDVAQDKHGDFMLSPIRTL